MNSVPAFHTSPRAFIVGVPRSGTTLLSVILNRHPQVCVTPETHFFRYLHRWKGGWDAMVGGWPESGNVFIRNMFNAELFGLDPAEVIASVPTPPPSPAEFLCAIGSHYARKHGKSNWIEKTPDHIRFLPQLRHSFPDVPIVHIVRDGRDVALSLSRTGWPWQSPHYLENLAQWVEQVNNGREYLADDRYTLTVRYEDLLNETEATVMDICNLLGLDFTLEMLEPDGSEARLIERGTAVKDLVRRPITKINQRKWWTELTPDLRLLSGLTAGAELAIWGYDVELLPVSGEQWCITQGVAAQAERFADSMGAVLRQQRPRLTVLRASVGESDKFDCDVVVLSDRLVSDIAADKEGARNRFRLWRRAWRRLNELTRTGGRLVVLCPATEESARFSPLETWAHWRAARQSALILCTEDRNEHGRQASPLLRAVGKLVFGRVSVERWQASRGSAAHRQATNAGTDGPHAKV